MCFLCDIRTEIAQLRETAEKLVQTEGLEGHGIRHKLTVDPEETMHIEIGIGNVDTGIVYTYDMPVGQFKEWVRKVDGDIEEQMDRIDQDSSNGRY